ncbi:hypothetical protein [Telmatospirillum siberiense]|uniref:Uncharacterized protein n=1 Tax=Telmatospirillum siberiense TaxID=382514 RepID=A0A2N3PZK1_9PROT|nr:hypothetical protein [Telmatospirillum siberiense]PKU25844.1 hypothetical protein CWS72_04615 [Telmatospirillum siberiense]
MKAKIVFPILVSMVVVSSAMAQMPDAPPRMTPAQMDAVHECAAAQGIDLPAPPSGGPGARGPMGGDHAMMARPDGKAPPPDDSDDGNPPARLSDAQKKIVDACFAANGLTPPPAPPSQPR